MLLCLSARRFVVRDLQLQVRIRRIARTIMELSLYLLRKDPLRKRIARGTHDPLVFLLF